MKIAVLSLSGNMGKTTLSRHLLVPRIKDCELISVETTNKDGQESTTIRGDRFTKLMMKVGTSENCVVDVGSSNSEDFLFFMKQQKGSHEDFSLFLIPVINDEKQMSDTIKTIAELKGLGVNANKIKVLLNKIVDEDEIESDFEMLLKYHKDSKAFKIIDKFVYENEVYRMLLKNKLTVSGVLNDKTDYQVLMKDAKDTQAKVNILEIISLRRLCLGVVEELDDVFKSVVAA
jgi:hypothetical protein